MEKCGHYGRHRKRTCAVVSFTKPLVHSSAVVQHYYSVPSRRRGRGRRLPPTPCKSSTLHLRPTNINFPKLNASPTHQMQSHGQGLSLHPREHLRKRDREMSVGHLQQPDALSPLYEHSAESTTPAPLGSEQAVAMDIILPSPVPKPSTSRARHSGFYESSEQAGAMDLILPDPVSKASTSRHRHSGFEESSEQVVPKDLILPSPVPKPSTSRARHLGFDESSEQAVLKDLILPSPVPKASTSRHHHSGFDENSEQAVAMDLIRPSPVPKSYEPKPSTSRDGHPGFDEDDWC